MERLAQILAAHRRGGKELIPILQEVQAAFGYIPKVAMFEVAKFLKMPESAIYGVATFYHQFRFTPLGRHHIRVCMGTACHMQRGDLVLEALERELDIKVGGITPDHQFSLERVACVGCCALAPVVVVNETVHPRMTPGKVEEFLVIFKHEIRGDPEPGEEEVAGFTE